MKPIRTFMAALFALSLIWGCDDDETTEEPATTEAEETEVAETEETEAEEAPSEGVAEVPPALFDEATFELRATAAESYTSGELGQFAIQIRPKGEFHMNDEYPTMITMHETANIEFPKSELEKADAAEWAAESARFDVPFTPSAAGQHTVVCDVSFAVCTDENCIPEERTLAVNLPVQ
jgi:hypothetical protein